MFSTVLGDSLATTCTIAFTSDLRQYAYKHDFPHMKI